MIHWHIFINKYLCKILPLGPNNSQIETVSYNIIEIEMV